VRKSSNFKRKIVRVCLGASIAIQYLPDGSLDGSCRIRREVTVIMQADTAVKAVKRHEKTCKLADERSLKLAICTRHCSVSPDPAGKVGV
jgi:hypothetical protein